MLNLLRDILSKFFSVGSAQASIPRSTPVPAPTQSVSLTKPDSLLSRIMMAESSGNVAAKAKTSSATGLYQFTDSTWRLVVNKWGKQYGLTLAGKNNPQQQHIAAQLLTEDNRIGLKRLLGRNPTDGELYIAHFAGVSGAASLIRNPNTIAARLLPTAAASNRSIFYMASGTPRTAKQVTDLLKSKVA